MLHYRLDGHNRLLSGLDQHLVSVGVVLRQPNSQIGPIGQNSKACPENRLLPGSDWSPGRVIFDAECINFLMHGMMRLHK